MHRFKAYAKINLALDILEKEASGYHKIQTIFQQVDLFDILTFKKRTDQKIQLYCNDKILPINSQNTILKAVELLKKTIKKIPFGLDIYLQKNIPISAGLGGGSSDAATTLLAINKLWKLNYPLQKLQKLAKKIGMDVPFFLYGGTTYGSHYGEKIKKLPALRTFPLLLIDPGIRSETKAAYQKIDSYKNGKDKTKTLRLIKKLTTLKQAKKIPSQVLKEISALVHNDFNKLYARRFQNLWKKILAEKARGVTCTGSGPLLYAIFDTSQDRLQAYKNLQKKRIKTWKINPYSIS